MKFLNIQAICLLTLALLQVASAGFALYWALPLFADPPLLQNGINRAAYSLSKLATEYPSEFRNIAWVPDHFRWLFVKHSEGVLLVLGCAVALLGSASVTVLFMCLQFGKFNLDRDTGVPSPNYSSKPTADAAA